MEEVIGLFNDTREVLSALRKNKVDVTMGRYFSQEGYKTCTLYGVGENTIYRCQTYILNDEYIGTISVKRNQEVPEILLSTMDVSAKINPDSTVEMNEVHQEFFIERIQNIKDWDEVHVYNANDNIPEEDKETFYELVVAIGSPILTF